MVVARCLLLIVLIATGCTLPASGAEPGVLAGRVWGLAKYHHPSLVTCAVDWDGVLLAQWSAIERAATASEVEVAIEQLLLAAGTTARRPVDADTPAWIVSAPLRIELREELAWLAAQQPATQCKVSAAPGTGIATFDADRDFATPNPDRAHRALAALRFWNAIEYFFPYKDVIGRDWAEVLSEHLPLVVDSSPGREYIDAMRRFTAQINDSHAALIHPLQSNDFGSGYPPFSVQLVEGRAIVLRVGSGVDDVSRGDQLLEVDGEPIESRMARLDRLGYGSNPVWRATATLRQALLGGPTGQFRLRRPGGSDYSVTLPRSGNTPVVGALPPVWQVKTLEHCSIGVIDMSRLQSEDVASVFVDLAETDALLFDIRNYPQGTLWSIVDMLFDAPQPVAEFTAPRLNAPGTFARRRAMLGGRTPSGYAGRVLLLQNEASISQSEYTLMGLQADDRAISFGSQTAGADGNITQMQLPGGLRIIFTGLGVFYPDGRQTQRVGIVPDVHVTPSQTGVAAGRDEVMEKALDCRWLTETPPKRRPAQGIYVAPEREGEGIDVQQSANGTTAVLSYHYDAEGEPEWMLSIDDNPQTQAQGNFLRYGPGATTQMPGYALDFHSGPYFPVCATADQSKLHPRGRWLRPVGTERREGCVLPFYGRERGAYTGIWTGTGSETGWGISVHQSDGELVMVVYAFDGAGHPRWLIGSAAVSDAGAATAQLTRVRGFCQACPAQPPVPQDGGTLTVSFADSDGSGGPWLSLDADFGDGVRWQRDRMPLVRLTAPPDP